MCQPATCRACGKATYRGCGQHVDQVLKGVPRSARCTCTAEQRRAASPSILTRLFGR